MFQSAHRHHRRIFCFWALSLLLCWINVQAMVLTSSTCQLPVSTSQSCDRAAIALRLDTASTVIDEPTHPHGCYYKQTESAEKLYFNTNGASFCTAGRVCVCQLHKTCFETVGHYSFSCPQHGYAGTTTVTQIGCTGTSKSASRTSIFQKAIVTVWGNYTYSHGRTLHFTHAATNTVTAFNDGCSLIEEFYGPRASAAHVFLYSKRSSYPYGSDMYLNINSEFNVLQANRGALAICAALCSTQATCRGFTRHVNGRCMLSNTSVPSTGNSSHAPDTTYRRCTSQANCDQIQAPTWDDPGATCGSRVHYVMHVQSWPIAQARCYVKGEEPTKCACLYCTTTTTTSTVTVTSVGTSTLNMLSGNATTPSSAVTSTTVTTIVTRSGTRTAASTSMVTSTTRTAAAAVEQVRGNMTLSMTNAVQFVREKGVELAFQIAISEIYKVNRTWVQQVVVRLNSSRRLLHSTRMLAQVNGVDVSWKIFIPPDDPLNVIATVIAEEFNAKAISEVTAIINDQLRRYAALTPYAVEVTWKYNIASRSGAGLPVENKTEPKDSFQWLLWICIGVSTLMLSLIAGLIFYYIRCWGHRPEKLEPTSASLHLDWSATEISSEAIARLAQCKYSHFFYPPEVIDENIGERMRELARAMISCDPMECQIGLVYAAGSRQADADGYGPGTFFAVAILKYLYDNNLQCFCDLLLPIGSPQQAFYHTMFGGRFSACRVVIVLQTKALYHAHNTMGEIYAACQNKLRLLPLRCEEELVEPDAAWPHVTKTALQEVVMLNEVVQKFCTLNSSPSPPYTIISQPSVLAEMVADLRLTLGQSVTETLFKRVSLRVQRLVTERVESTKNMPSAIAHSIGRIHSQDPRERTQSDPESCQNLLTPSVAVRDEGCQHGAMQVKENELRVLGSPSVSPKQKRTKRTIKQIIGKDATTEVPESGGWTEKQSKGATEAPDSRGWTEKRSKCATEAPDSRGWTASRGKDGRSRGKERRERNVDGTQKGPNRRDKGTPRDESPTTKCVVPPRSESPTKQASAARSKRQFLNGTQRRLPQDKSPRTGAQAGDFVSATEKCIIFPSEHNTDAASKTPSNASKPYERTSEKTSKGASAKVAKFKHDVLVLPITASTSTSYERSNTSSTKSSKSATPTVAKENIKHEIIAVDSISSSRSKPSEVIASQVRK